MKMRLLPVGLMFALYFFTTSTFAAANRSLNVGSKKFTESIVLGEIARLALVEKDQPTTHLSGLGGTRILWNALLAGNIDLYPEYTSTIEEELLKQKFKSLTDLRAALAERGVGITEPLGFNNTYAIGMKKDRAKSLGIQKISDLARHPELKLGWGEEFRRRSDGWPGLKTKYQLPQRLTRGLDHDVAYRALESGDIDVTDLYSTDAEIQYYDLLILKDDQNFFPKYDAIFLYRLQTARENPVLIEAIEQLEGQIAEPEMIAMNMQAKLDKIPSGNVASRFLNEKFDLKVEAKLAGRAERIRTRTVEHLVLVVVSMTFAILIAIPLGVLAEKNRHIGRGILGLVGGIQTIPSLALLVILIQPLNMVGLSGIGDTPAMIALFLYSLLPIVRGTHSGLEQIPISLVETASVLGLSRRTRLLRIELPLALPSILSGIKTAVVMNVGFATLGALIGAGGFGQPILTGIRLDDYGLILEGAIPSAIMALLAQQAFEWIDRLVISPGLRR